MKTLVGNRVCIGIEIGQAIVIVKWFPNMKATETAPAEGGDFEVVDIQGIFTDDEIPDLEEQAIGMAWDRMEDQRRDGLWNR